MQMKADGSRTRICEQRRANAKENEREKAKEIIIYTVPTFGVSVPRGTADHGDRYD